MKKILFSLSVTLSYFANTPMAGAAETVLLTNPLKVNSISQLIAEILNLVVVIAVPLAVIMLVYTGFSYVMARGKPEAVSKVHNMFLWTVVGIAVIFGAAMIAGIIQGTFCQLGFIDLCGGGGGGGGTLTPTGR